ncbi:hypothetical protein NQ318_006565 [Aromia moschata]|uniref:Uncharacterized protein n=1 Tax=Aromia moschata TaxID=1265417 RepID=A0AAV8YPV6_9CUCU|nr:hypothetical protein NQ318_006565 [Aromia moschata]
MGDSITNQDEIAKEKTEPHAPSSEVNPLHPAKPLENIAVVSKTPSNSQEKIEKIHDGLSADSLAKVEHRAEVEEKIVHKPEAKRPENERKPLIDSLVPQKADTKDRFESKSSPAAPAADKKARVGSAASGLVHGERINRNQSDIFSLKEETSIASSIFSVNGSPSRKVFRRKELTASNVFPFGQKEEPPSDKATAAPTRDKPRDSKESYNELRRPSSSVRNPLTGTGLSSNDEYKFKGSKRKDGNPLLGLGYSPEATPSAHRIPPGGYSHKLW